MGIHDVADLVQQPLVLGLVGGILVIGVLAHDVSSRAKWAAMRANTSPRKALMVCLSALSRDPPGAGH
jgi:hypothetical protein